MSARSSASASRVSPASNGRPIEGGRPRQRAGYPRRATDDPSKEVVRVSEPGIPGEQRTTHRRRSSASASRVSPASNGRPIKGGRPRQRAGYPRRATDDPSKEVVRVSEPGIPGEQRTTHQRRSSASASRVSPASNGRPIEGGRPRQRAGYPRRATDDPSKEVVRVSEPGIPGEQRTTHRRRSSASASRVSPASNGRPIKGGRRAR